MVKIGKIYLALKNDYYRVFPIGSSLQVALVGLFAEIVCRFELNFKFNVFNAANLGSKFLRRSENSGKFIAFQGLSGEGICPQLS